MSVLRYNVVSDKKPYRPREEHLRNFFANVRRGTQPVDSFEESTLVTERATNDLGSTSKKQKGIGKTTKKRSQPRKDNPSKKAKAEDKINGHRFE